MLSVRAMDARSYPVVYRVMHWAIALCMLALLLTIFLRATWMNREHVANIIQGYMPTADVTLSREQAVALAKKIRAPMWQWHIYLGYALVGLYGVRMALPLFGAMPLSNPLREGLSRKVKFQFAVYLVFYACMAVSLCTGLLIVLGPRGMKETVEGIHALSIYYLLAFIALHLGGVLLAEFTSDQGIVSRIVSGARAKAGNLGGADS